MKSMANHFVTFQQSQMRTGKFLSRDKKDFCDGMIEKLNNSWRRRLADNLLDNCQGYFNFYESEVETFNVSILKRFLRGLKVRMADQLRDYWNLRLILGATTLKTNNCISHRERDGVVLIIFAKLYNKSRYSCQW